MTPDSAVVDTNVLISAALAADSVPAQVVDLLLRDSVLLFSDETFLELTQTLCRRKFDRYLSLEHRQGLLHDFAAVSQWVALPTEGLTRHCRDPKDEMFIHTALQGGATWLVSGDQDLLVLSMAPRLEILSPAQALGKLQRL